MNMLKQIFWQGILTLLPIVLTGYVVYWLCATAEFLLGPLLRMILPNDTYITGMGVLAGVLIVFLVGLLMKLWLTKLLFHCGEWLLQRVPLIKTVYGSVRDLMSFLSASQKEDMQGVVMVTFPDSGMRIMGMATRYRFDDLPEGVADDGMTAVYLPMSYQIGGFTLIIPEEHVRPIDFSVEECLRFSLTAGIANRRNLTNGNDQKEEVESSNSESERSKDVTNQAT